MQSSRRAMQTNAQVALTLAVQNWWSPGDGMDRDGWPKVQENARILLKWLDEHDARTD